ncbi:tetratricopeptide repeat protein [Streptomyces sp. NPDC051217]|uniref:tetratricopeptide repeat protein n=1 Tax=Streptomyces sp. NPDC051217 TaxID=3365644 RepID=UPI0037A9027E
MVLERLDPNREQTEQHHDVATSHVEAAVHIAVTGMGGVGKTALALHAAHQASARGYFTGGILFADLRGYTPGAALDIGGIADRFLRVLGVRDQNLPFTSEGKRDAWHMMLNKMSAQGNPLLVVLDNVRTADQVAGLLPGSPHRALITSRHTLSTLPVYSVSLKPFAETDAVNLLDEALRVANSSDTRVTAQLSAAQHLVKLCGYLPLALWIIAALLRDEPDRALEDQLRELIDIRTRLDVLAYDAVDEQGRSWAVRATFELSYQHLTGTQAAAFRLLAGAPGADISTTATTILLNQPNVRRLLASLARAHLLQSAPDDRWVMHDLIRIFASEKGQLACASADGRESAVVRLLDYYFTTAQAADYHLDDGSEIVSSGLFNDREHALTWLDAERANLVAAAVAAFEMNHQSGTEMTFVLAQYFDQRRHLIEWITLCEATVAHCRKIGNVKREGMALVSLGAGYREARRFEESIDAYVKAGAIFEIIGDWRREGFTSTGLRAASRESRRFVNSIDRQQRAVSIFREIDEFCELGSAFNGLSTTLAEVHRLDEAISAARTAAAVFLSTGNHAGAGSALNNLGVMLGREHRFDEAIKAHNLNIDICRELGSRHSEALGLSNLGTVLSGAGRFDEAISAHSEAVAIFREAGDRHREGQALNNLGIVLNQVGRFDEAISAHSEAVAIFREAGDPIREGTALNNLGMALQETQQFDEAITAHSRDLVLCRENEDPHGEGIALNGLACALRQVQRIKESIDACTSAISLAQETGDRRNEGCALNNLGIALMDINRSAEAEDAYGKAAAIFREIGDHESEAQVVHNSTVPRGDHR